MSRIRGEPRRETSPRAPGQTVRPERHRAEVRMPRDIRTSRRLLASTSPETPGPLSTRLAMPGSWVRSALTVSRDLPGNETVDRHRLRTRLDPGPGDRPRSRRVPPALAGGCTEANVAGPAR